MIWIHTVWMNMNDPKGTCDIVWLIVLSHVCGKLDRQVPELACQVAHCRGTKTKSQDVSSLDLSMGLRICWHTWAWKKRSKGQFIILQWIRMCVFFHMRCVHVFSSCVAVLWLGSDFIWPLHSSRAKPVKGPGPQRLLVGQLRYSFDVVWLCVAQSQQFQSCFTWQLGGSLCAYCLRWDQILVLWDPLLRWGCQWEGHESSSFLSSSWTVTRRTGLLNMATRTLDARPSATKCAANANLLKVYLGKHL